MKIRDSSFSAKPPLLSTQGGNMARYTKIHATIWTSQRFIGLSDADRVAFIYICTCEHQTSIGVARIPPKYGSADLERLESDFTASLDRIETAGLVKVDRSTNEVFVHHWFDFHPPTNSKHAQGLRKVFDEVKSPAVRATALQEFESAEWSARPAREADTQTIKPGKRAEGGPKEIPF